MKIINDKNKNLIYDEHKIIELNLSTRQFNMPTNYVIAVNGDNNSQILTFEFDRYYDNIDLLSTNCMITYWTSWLDDSDPPKHSFGQVTLDNSKKIIGDKIQTTWVLNHLQTFKPGYCLFMLTFYKPNIENPQQLIEVIPVQDAEGNWYLQIEKAPNELQSNYYFLSSDTGKFDIAEAGFGESRAIKVPIPEIDNVDQHYNPTSPKAQSGFAIAEVANSIEIDNNNNFANVIKQEKSGYIISVSDVSPIQHNVQCKISGASNPMTVKVTRCGKNLAEKQPGTITIKTAEAVLDFKKDLTFPKLTISFDLKNFTSSNIGSALWLINKVDGSSVEAKYIPAMKNFGIELNAAPINKHISYSFENMTFSRFRMSYYGGLTGTIENLQIEIGDETSFETINRVEFTSEVDGTIKNIESISPNMSLLADTPGAIIDIEYNANTKTYVDNKTEIIQTVNRIPNKIFANNLTEISVDKYTAIFKAESVERAEFVLAPSVYVRWTEVKNQLGEGAVLSADGKTLTITIKYYDVLIYSTAEKKFKFIRMPMSYAAEDIVCIATATGGINGGCLYDQYTQRLSNSNKTEINEIKSSDLFAPASTFNMTFLNKYNTALIRSGKAVTQILYFTDAHCFFTNPTQIMPEYVRPFRLLKEAYDHGSFDHTLCGGDFINFHEDITPEVGFRQLSYIHGVTESLFKKYHPVVGNHEYAYYTGYKNILTEEQIKNSYMPEYNELYYVYETPFNKIIVLQTGIDGDALMKESQKIWLKNELKNSNKDMIIAEHIAYGGTESAPTITKSFIEIRNILDSYNKRSGEFSNVTHKVLCVISGHTHFYHQGMTETGIQVIAADRLLRSGKVNYYGLIIDNSRHILTVVPSEKPTVEYNLVHT